jgi:hypothetical protein
MMPEDYGEASYEDLSVSTNENQHQKTVGHARRSQTYGAYSRSSDRLTSYHAATSHSFVWGLQSKIPVHKSRCNRLEISTDLTQNNLISSSAQVENLVPKLRRQVCLRRRGILDIHGSGSVGAIPKFRSGLNCYHVVPCLQHPRIKSAERPLKKGRDSVAASCSFLALSGQRAQKPVLPLISCVILSFTTTSMLFVTNSVNGIGPSGPRPPKFGGPGTRAP